MITDDRDLILQRLQAHVVEDDAAHDEPYLSPQQDPVDKCEAFMTRAKKNDAEVIRLTYLSMLPQVVTKHLQKNNMSLSIVCEKFFSHLSWEKANIQAQYRAPTIDDSCGITHVPVAAADTGAMLQTDASAHALTLSLLPPYHIAVLAVSDIVATMAQLFQRLPIPLPRGCSLFCGPSRTADIEQTLTLGVHGPLSVLVVVVDDMNQ